MLCKLKLHPHLSTTTLPTTTTLSTKYLTGESLPSRRLLLLRLPHRKFVSAALRSEISNNSSTSKQPLTSSVGYPSSAAPVIQWIPTQRHVTVLSFIACATAISATWLFCSAIPMLMAFKKAAESMEKLMDVTREELPDTMAAVRLSGMEISDLTMELSDLGQEITQGVKSSTRAVRLAEERLRRLTNMAPPVYMQEVKVIETKTSEPVLAKTARGVREKIVKGRSVVRTFFTVTRFSKIVFNYFKSRAKA